MPRTSFKRFKLSKKGILLQAATIKLFLVHGSPNGLRTAELSNWSGKAVAAPRTEIVELLKREELSGSGFYLLTVSYTHLTLPTKA